jgi:aspartate dehydrogenase
MLKIALIGYGTIAGYVADQLRDRSEVQISQVLCRSGREDAARQALGTTVIPVTDVQALSDDLSFVVDCAGHGALRQFGPDILSRGLDLVTVSNGLLAEQPMKDRLEASARRGGSKLHLLSGAVGGMDALAAASAGGLTRVVYTGRKPAAGWRGTAAEDVVALESLTEAAVHFEGSAREAALRYPKNANVAATIALAGIGLDQTEVKLIADPGIQKNCHQVEAEGAFGRFTFSIEGEPLPKNDKSSALTAMSVVRFIEQREAPVQSG